MKLKGLRINQPTLPIYYLIFRKAYFCANISAFGLRNPVEERRRRAKHEEDLRTSFIIREGSKSQKRPKFSEIIARPPWVTSTTSRAFNSSTTTSTALLGTNSDISHFLCFFQVSIFFSHKNLQKSFNLLDFHVF